MMGNFISGAKEDIEKPTNLAILDLDRSEYSENILNKLSEQSNIKVEILEEQILKKPSIKPRERNINTFSYP